MAIYPGALQKLIRPDANDPKITMRAVVLHVDAGNADSLYSLFLGNQRPGGSKVEAHFFVKTNGVIEQYRDTAYQADAAYASNDFAIQIETQGYGAGHWTLMQIAALKKLLMWCHAMHQIPLVRIPAYNGSGVGYHSQFQQWNLSNHSCPGPERIKQYEQVLLPWMAGINAIKPAADTHVTIGRDLISSGLKHLDAAGNHGRRRVALIAKAIHVLINQLPER